MRDLKNYLEELMDLKRTCTIRFRADNGAVTTLSTRVMDLSASDGRLIVKVESGLEIKPERIISIDGHYFEGLA